MEHTNEVATFLGVPVAEIIASRARLLERSEAFAAVATALAKAQATFTPIEKNRTARIQMKAGGSYTYEYADLAAIREAISPALSANGLALLQPFELSSRNGQTTLRLQTELIHESGEWFRTPVLEVGVDLGDIKALGIAITYLRRYQVQALLGIAPDTDVDAGEGETLPMEETRRAPGAYEQPGTGNFRCRFGSRHQTAATAKDCKGHTGRKDEPEHPELEGPALDGPALTPTEADGLRRAGADLAAKQGSLPGPAKQKPTPDALAELIAEAITKRDWRTVLETLPRLPADARRKELEEKYQATRYPKETVSP